MAKRRRGCDDVKDDLPRHLERRGAPPVPAPAHAKKSKTGGSYPDGSAKPRSAGARASLYCVYAVNPTPGCSDHESEHDRAGTGLVKHVTLTTQDAQITRVSTTGVGFTAYTQYMVAFLRPGGRGCVWTVHTQGSRHPGAQMTRVSTTGPGEDELLLCKYREWD